VSSVEAPNLDRQQREDALAAFIALRESDMRVWRRASASLDLSSPGTFALTMILRADLREQPLRQIDLGQALRLSPAGVSSIVDDLEKRRLVQRAVSSSDRRAFLLRAGEAAGSLLDALRRSDEEVLAYMDECTPDQVEAITALLERVRALRDSTFSE